MRRLRSMRLALLAVAACAAAAPSARAEDALVVGDTRLHTPPDSHEPQRALIDLRNAGPDGVTRVTLRCAFTGAGGSVLDTKTATVPGIAAGATVQAEAIYYGWPRATGAACRLAEAR